jgi:hypothetical protein
MSPQVSPNFSKKEAISVGFKIAKENVFFFIGVLVICALVTAFSSGIQESLNLNKQYTITLIFNLFMWVVNSVVSLGLINIALKLVDGQKPELKDLYYTTKLFNYILANLIKTVIIIAGFILFIIPGIIFSIKLQFSEYFIVDKKMDAIDSLKASWEVTKGIKWNLFLFGILLGLINLLGILCFLVGLVITVPLSMVATAYIYRKHLSQSFSK